MRRLFFTLSLSLLAAVFSCGSTVETSATRGGVGGALVDAGVDGSVDADGDVSCPWQCPPGTVPSPCDPCDTMHIQHCCTDDQ